MNSEMVVEQISKAICKFTELGDIPMMVLWLDEIKKTIQSLQAENDRLRKVELQAKYTKNWLVALCKECRYYKQDANICTEEGKMDCDTIAVIRRLDDALKGGS